MTTSEECQIIKHTERLVSIMRMPKVAEFETIVLERIDYAVTVLNEQLRTVKEGD